MVSSSRFLSTPSARRATQQRIHNVTETIGFLSTPSARRATSASETYSRSLTHFYPRPPRGGRPFDRGGICQSQRVFLSTPSARRATRSPAPTPTSGINFYPRPPRGGRPSRLSAFSIILNFYPRPPRGGRRGYAARACLLRSYFYPRPPRGGRQQKQRQNLYFLINYTTFCTNLEEP